MSAPLIRCDQVTCYGNALFENTGPGAQVTEVLEALGITLAYDICAAVPVKGPDQLPGISIIQVIAVFGSIIIVVYKTADFFSVAIHLFIVGLSGILADNGPGHVP